MGILSFSYFPSHTFTKPKLNSLNPKVTQHYLRGCVYWVPLSSPHTPIYRYYVPYRDYDSDPLNWSYDFSCKSPVPHFSTHSNPES